VFFTLVLLGLILYVFGIIFKSQVQEGSMIQKEYFATVWSSMWHLLMHGTFLDSVSTVAEDVWNANAVLGFTFLIFIFISCLTVMNMLIGIVCEVIDNVKQGEEEQIDKFFLETNLLDVLECYDMNDDHHIGKKEFDLFMQNPEVIDALHKFGTDPKGLALLSQITFDDSAKMDESGNISHFSKATEGNAKLPFDQVLEMINRLKGDNPSSVTDIMELRKFVQQALEQQHQEAGIERSGALRVASEERAAATAKLQKITDRLDELSMHVQGADFDAKPRPVVDVTLTIAGKTVVQRHASTLSIERLLLQFVETHGRLVAKVADGVEIGPELTIGEVALQCAGKPTLHLVAPEW